MNTGPVASRLGLSKATAVVVIIVVIVIAGVAVMFNQSSSVSSSSSSSSSRFSSTTTPAVTSTSTTQQSVIKLNVVTSVPASADYFLPMLTGQRQGIFQKYGLDVTWVPYSGGGALQQAVAAGNAQIGLWGVFNVVSAAGNGLAIKVLGVYIPVNPFEIYVKGDSPIKSFKELNGTSVGVSSLQGLEQLYFSMVAKRTNITLNYVATGGPTSSAALLSTGRISAMVYNRDSVLKLVDAGQIRSIYKVADSEPSNWQDGECVFATSQFIQQNPEAVRRFVTAFFAITQFIVNNPQATTQLYISQTNSTQKVAQEAYSGEVWQTNGHVNTDAIQSMEDTYFALGLMKTKPPASSLYDTSFLPS